MSVSSTSISPETSSPKRKRNRKVGKTISQKRDERSIFVIMPFQKTPKRNSQQLTAFFADFLKKRIEASRFAFRYVVRRSDDTFNITEKIVRDIYRADIVICDLSGHESNPNVMYELGMRLALTHKPVILIREANEGNKTLFDISGFFAHPYDPLNYEPLLDHLIAKIQKLESGGEPYKSPVLSILEAQDPLLERMSSQRAREKLLFMKNGVLQVLRIYSGKLATFLTDNQTGIDIGKSTGDVLEKIQKQGDKFDKIDFSKFHFAFSSQPLIDSYLSEQYLNNIASPDLVAPFTLFVIAYHATFLGTNVLHNSWYPYYIYLFVGETNLFLAAIDQVYKYLKTEDKEEKESLTKKLKLLLTDSKLGGIERA